MFRFALLLAFAALFSGVAVPARQARVVEPSLRLEATPLELLAAQGSLWALTCDRGCTGEARYSTGRIVRIDPRSGRVAASAILRRPGRIAIGASGVYATDFWRDRIRRIDLRTLQVVGSLKLRLPFRFTARDNAFVPLAVAVGHAVWVATDRGAVARTDLQLRNVVATVRLPLEAFGGITVGPGAVWLAESLAGVYRIDPRTNHVIARIRIPLAAGSLDAEQIVLSGGKVLAIGAKTSANMLTGRNGVARIDPQRNRVEAVTPLPSGPLAVTVGQGSLWVARVGGSSVERVDPRTGKVVARIRGQIGTALAVAGGYLWTASREGTIRKLKQL
jgi:streptogramin lyase